MTCCAPTPPNTPAPTTIDPRPRTGYSITTCIPPAPPPCCCSRPGTWPPCLSPSPARCPRTSPTTSTHWPGSPPSARRCWRRPRWPPRRGSTPTPGRSPRPWPSISNGVDTGTTTRLSRRPRAPPPSTPVTWPDRPAPTACSAVPPAGPVPTRPPPPTFGTRLTSTANSTTARARPTPSTVSGGRSDSKAATSRRSSTPTRLWPCTGRPATAPTPSPATSVPCASSRNSATATSRPTSSAASATPISPPATTPPPGTPGTRPSPSSTTFTTPAPTTHAPDWPASRSRQIPAKDVAHPRRPLRVMIPNGCRGACRSRLARQRCAGMSTTACSGRSPEEEPPYTVRGPAPNTHCWSAVEGRRGRRSIELDGKSWAIHSPCHLFPVPARLPSGLMGHGQGVTSDGNEEAGAWLAIQYPGTDCGAGPHRGRDAPGDPGSAWKLHDRTGAYRRGKDALSQLPVPPAHGPTTHAL